MFTYGLCFEFDGEDELSECCKHLVNTYERMKSGLDTRTHHVNVYTSAKVIQTPTGPNVKIEVSGLANAIRLFEEQKKNAEEILQGLKDLAEKAVIFTLLLGPHLPKKTSFRSFGPIDAFQAISPPPFHYIISHFGGKGKVGNVRNYEDEFKMEGILNLSTILTIVGILVVLTNIVVQVLKKLTWDRLPTNVLAVVVSMVLTLVAFFSYCQIKAIAVVWYMVAAAVVMGFMVSYAAMFGYDKLMEAIGKAGKS